jgi:hypothetical protein
MKKTFKEIMEADYVVSGILGKNSSLQNSKFNYAWKKFIKMNIEKLLKERNEKLVEARIDNALEDENKALITDKDTIRGYKYSKEGLKQCIRKETEIVEKYDDKEIEIKPYFCESLPELTDEEKELLKGLIIK